MLILAIVFVTDLLVWALVSLVVLSTLTVSTSVCPSHCKRPAVRKEWCTLSLRERKEWITAVNCLATLPHDETLTPMVKPSNIVGVNASGSYYDDIVHMHMDMNHKIHFTGLFLPWHR